MANKSTFEFTNEEITMITCGLHLYIDHIRSRYVYLDNPNAGQEMQGYINEERTVIDLLKTLKTKK